MLRELLHLLATGFLFPPNELQAPGISVGPPLPRAEPRLVLMTFEAEAC